MPATSSGENHVKPHTYFLSHPLLRPRSDQTRRSLALDRQKDTLLDEISQRLQQNTGQETLFVIAWSML
ncbi:MAG: hypothetical protein WCK35_18120 [Chloroflexota bacterium]